MDNLLKTDFRKIMGIEKKAYDVLSSYWNGIVPVDIYSIAEFLCFSIHYENLDNGISSVLRKNKDNSTIMLINDKLSLKEQRFVIAHNVGHSVLHLNEKHSEFIDSHAIFNNSFKNTSIEWEANLFAISLLSPIETFKNDLNIAKKNNIPDLLLNSYLSAKYNISSFVIETKLDLIDSFYEQEVNSLCG